MAGKRSNTSPEKITHTVAQDTVHQRRDAPATAADVKVLADKVDQLGGAAGVLDLCNDIDSGVGRLELAFKETVEQLGRIIADGVTREQRIIDGVDKIAATVTAQLAGIGEQLAQQAAERARLMKQLQDASTAAAAAPRINAPQVLAGQLPLPATNTAMGGTAVDLNGILNAAIQKRLGR